MAAKKKAPNAQLVGLLNRALGWELRAQAMYAHYAAYVKGIESLSLGAHFEKESLESVGHAGKVRAIIAELGGVAATDRDPAAIRHTEDWRVMLQEALKTESAAAATYARLLPMVKGHAVHTHTLMHIMMDEQKAVVEVETLLGR